MNLTTAPDLRNLSDGALYDAFTASGDEAEVTAMVAEMDRRGYNHKTPLPVNYPVVINDLAVTIDRDAAKAELLRRCPECAERASK